MKNLLYILVISAVFFSCKNELEQKNNFLGRAKYLADKAFQAAYDCETRNGRSLFVEQMEACNQEIELLKVVDKWIEGDLILIKLKAFNNSNIRYNKAVIDSSKVDSKKLIYFPSNNAILISGIREEYNGLLKSIKDAQDRIAYEELKK